jgi:ketosteroid isomerase-like protein
MKHLIPLFLIVLFAACNDAGKTDTTIADEPKKDTVEFSRSALEETNKIFTASALKGDSATIVGLYHPDARVFAPNEEAMSPKTMASMTGGFAKMGITSFTLDTKEIYEGDDVVTEVGTYEMGDGKKTIDKGKYMVVWKKDGDKWKLYRDIWNSDNPPPPPPKKK